MKTAIPLPNHPWARFGVLDDFGVTPVLHLPGARALPWTFSEMAAAAEDPTCVRIMPVDDDMPLIGDVDVGDLNQDRNQDRVALVGLAAPYEILSGPKPGNWDGCPYELYRMRFCRGAFSRWLASGVDIPLVMNHDGVTPLASTARGTLRFWEGTHGLGFYATVALDADWKRQALGNAAQVAVSTLNRYPEAHWQGNAAVGPVHVIIEAEMIHLAIVQPRGAFAEATAVVQPLG
jgi:hypothetical protein